MLRYVLTIFLLDALLWQWASGILMCEGPFNPPSLDRITVEPLDKSDVGRPGSVVTVEMTSEYSLSAKWWPEGAVGDGFNSSVQKNGNQYALKFVDGQQNTTNDFKQSSGLANIEVDYGCNTIIYATTIWGLLEMEEVSLHFPVIYEMPKLRNTLGVNEENIELVLSLSREQDPWDFSDWFQCTKLFARRGEQLTHSSGQEKHGTFIEGISFEGRCLTKLSPNVDGESFMIVTALTNRLSLKTSLLIFVLTEVQRVGINKPALTVETKDRYRVSYKENGETIIPGIPPITTFYCTADGEDVKVSASRVRSSDPTDLEVLTSAGSAAFRSPLIQSIRYIIPSPAPYKNDVYVCTTSNKYGVATSKFTVTGGTLVTIIEKTPVPMIRYQLIGKNKTTLRMSCEAIGSPRPYIKFYTNVRRRNMPPEPRQFQQKFRNNEITQSDLYDISGTFQGNKTVVDLFVKDVKEVVNRLPDGYWDESYTYNYHCFAYNINSADIRHMGGIKQR